MGIRFIESSIQKDICKPLICYDGQLTNSLYEIICRWKNDSFCFLQFEGENTLYRPFFQEFAPHFVWLLNL
jgi:hypothetical protein